MKTSTQEELMKSIPTDITICAVKEKYLMVEWPEIQEYMDHPRWSECIFCMEIDGHPCPDGAYMVPETLYNEKNFNYELGD